MTDNQSKKSSLQKGSGNNSSKLPPVETMDSWLASFQAKVKRSEELFEICSASSEELTNSPETVISFIDFGRPYAFNIPRLHEHSNEIEECCKQLAQTNVPPFSMMSISALSLALDKIGSD